MHAYKYRAITPRGQCHLISQSTLILYNKTCVSKHTTSVMKVNRITHIYYMQHSTCNIQLLYSFFEPVTVTNTNARVPQ